MAWSCGACTYAHAFEQELYLTCFLCEQPRPGTERLRRGSSISSSQKSVPSTPATSSPSRANDKGRGNDSMNDAGSARKKSGGLGKQAPPEVAAAFPAAAPAAPPKSTAAVADSIDLSQGSCDEEGVAGTFHVGQDPLPVHSSAAHGAGAEAGGNAEASGQQGGVGGNSCDVLGLDLGQPLFSYDKCTAALDTAAERAGGWAKIDNSNWVRMGSDKKTAAGNEQMGRAKPSLLAQMVELTALTPRDCFVDVGSGCGQVSSAIVRR